MFKLVGKINNKAFFLGFVIFSLFLMAGLCEAAYLVNVPQTIRQPNGTVLPCYASGDEYYNWLHDSAGYTIVQDPITGFYVYAEPSPSGGIRPSAFIAGMIDPAAAGLKSNLRVAADLIERIRKDFLQAQVMNDLSPAPKKGSIANIVVFIRFQSEFEFGDPISAYSQIFNASGSGNNSMYNYFREVSYDSLSIQSSFYPISSTYVVSYQDSQPRGYYQPYNAVTNPGGYSGGENGSERMLREHTLLKNAIDAISSQIPGGLVIDGDGDGDVDNVIFVVSGSPTGWGSLLWPHKGSLYSQTALISGKRVYTYNLQLRNALYVSVLCHEMFHTIGSPDLYHYTDNGITPVGRWDIMENDFNPPQHMGAYMKWRYGTWIASIPEITTSGTYTLNPLLSSTGNCFKIKSTTSTSEYFVLEYRRRTGTFEASLPGEGLLVYRINTLQDGLGNRNGPPDEVYIYRPGGSILANGTPNSAAFSSNVGQTAINDGTNPSSFLSTGGPGGLNILNIGTVGATISFDVAFSPQISGYVRSSEGKGIPSVLISYSNGGGTATTDASGKYIIYISSGWSGIVTPTLAGYTFNPTSHSYSNVTSNQADQNFVANAVISTYTISGSVTSGGIALPNVVMSGLPGNPLTNSSGQYSGLVNSGWTGTVTPVLAGYTFTPTNRSYSSVIANQAGQDYSAIAIIIPTTMRQVLIDLYNSTNGDSWTNKTGWKTPPLHSDGFALPGTEGTWYGVSVSPVLKDVVALNLQSNNLVGSLPSSLGNFKYLNGLYLQENQLTGIIPPSIGNLSNLEDLVLNNNRLSGSIPTELGNLSNLKKLFLDSNQLSGSIPSSLGNLSKLTNFFLNSNKLSGSIPNSLTNLTKLNWQLINIRYNALYTSDAGLLGFLNSKQGVDWVATQTIPPTNVSAKSFNSTSVNISWTPIPYVGDTGGYRIFISTVPGGPFSFRVQTTNKGAPSQLVTDLTTGIPYFFKVQTRTDAHYEPSTGNQNVIDSEYSSEVTATPSIPPTIGLSKSSFNFGSERYGIPTPAETAILTNKGTETLNWTATPSVDWISVLPGSGTNSGVLTIGVSRTDMPPGYYTGTIAISDPKASNSPQTINVGLDVIPVGNDSPPFGNYATPADGATVASSIPVTGWVLDDVGVQSVKIYRGTGLSDRVYIGDAVFSKGARPDVEVAYPGYPQNDRAGWGYMLLTNFLPNGGNGPFTLLAYAIDTGGHEVLLGSKSITCDNLNAVKPFGAIDTPTQGGTASGSAFVNFGWVLTPQPNLIPINGSTITVWVDGLPLGHPTYNNYRSDIATLFPGYANSNGAVGYYYINTTGFENKVHTIAWSVADSGGNVDGIGSRYFTIQNVAGGSGVTESLMKNVDGVETKASPDSPISYQNTGIRSVSEIAAIPEGRRTPIYVKRGYMDDQLAETVFPETDGSIHLLIPEISRVAIYLDAKETRESDEDKEARSWRILLGSADSGETSRFEAYELVMGELRPLPIGATFDTERGLFYWQPGPGFLGEYQFVIVDKEKIFKKAVKITIVPARDPI